MSQPAQRSQKTHIKQSQRRLLWVLLFVIIASMALEFFIQGGGALLYTKSLACGALLFVVAQLIFGWAAYRQEGARLRQQVVHNMYLAQMLKWAIGLVGFVLIFTQVRPLIAPMAIFGFVLMQLMNVAILWRMHK